jgi:putative aldouronate transport system substrate-binding protein
MKVLRICFLLMLVPALVMAGGGSQSGGNTQSGLITVTMAQRMHAAETPQDWNAPLQKLTIERTGVKPEIEYWPEANWVELSNLRLASGSLPDLMYVSPDQAALYGMEGVFDPLDDLIRRYAPNITKLMTPENVAPLKAPDGKMYQINTYDESNSFPSQTFDYRMDILREMGEPEPSNPEEWYQLFKRVKARYPNMIPLVERSRRIDDFSHTAFDMGKLWNEDYYGIIGAEYSQRKIHYLPMTNEWKDMLQWYAKLYAENLLDHEYLTIPYDDWWERKISGGIAFACWTMNQSRAAQANDLAHQAGLNYVQWGCARTMGNYKTGERWYYFPASPWDQRGGYSLSAKSRVKEAAIRLVDFYYTEEWWGFARGRVTVYNGVEMMSMPGADWQKYIGSWGTQYNPQYWPINEGTPKSADGSDNPGYDHFQKNYKNNTSLVGLPPVNRTGDLNRWMTVTTDLKTYIERSMDEFITGRRSFSQWDAYLAEIRRLGVDWAVGETQKWYDAYWRSVGSR